MCGSIGGTCYCLVLVEQTWSAAGGLVRLGSLNSITVHVVGRNSLALHSVLAVSMRTAVGRRWRATNKCILCLVVSWGVQKCTNMASDS